MLLSVAICWGAAFAGQESAVPKVEAKLEVGGKYQVAGTKIKITATLPAAAGAQATDSIEVHSLAGEKPVNVQPLGQSVLVEAGAGGGQKRTGEWTVPELPAGAAEVFWKCGDQIVGPATIEVLKPIREVDWDKVEAAALSKASVLVETDLGQMLLEFYPDKAPGTVRNFLKLSAKGFYDGVTFHRIIKGFMVQGGDPTGTGAGDPGYKIKDEFNDTKHLKGVISMAHTIDPDSGGCQFFIVHGDQVASLDGKYAAFGKLLDGYDALDRIASVPTSRGRDGNMSAPKQKIFMRKVTVVEKPVVR